VLHASLEEASKGSAWLDEHQPMSALEFGSAQSPASLSAPNLNGGPESVFILCAAARFYARMEWECPLRSDLQLSLCTRIVAYILWRDRIWSARHPRFFFVKAFTRQLEVLL